VIDASDARAIRAFKRRLEFERGSGQFVLKIGASTVAVDEEGSQVFRRDAAGGREWSIPFHDHLRVRRPYLFTDGRRIFVLREFKDIMALEPETGQVVWRAKVSSECFWLSGDLLLLAHNCQVVALAADSGEERFRLSLPADKDFRPVEIEEFAGLFLIQAHEAPGGKGDSFLIDRDGQIRYRFPRQIVAVVPAGQDRLFLTSADVRRVTPDGRTVWSISFTYPEWIAGGKILAIPDGDRVAFLYGGICNSGVQLIRFNPDSGEVRWQASCEPLSDVSHSEYQHDVEVKWIAGDLRVISCGSAGTFVEWLDGKTGGQLRRGEQR
jgi:outer membrane protein assembly factor BamB